MARKKKKDNVRRAIEIEGLDITLELSKATAIKTDKQMIHLDQLGDGTWRLIYNGNLVPDFTKVKSLKIIREDDFAEEPISNATNSLPTDNNT